ncbi:hypothetical protein ACH4U6_36955 [Streptomyces netropsis]|uniref:hypothetical protein n=1 Tax=Streptomyces netropsis TaxID=55404 RepID=UPI00379EB716
MTTPVAETHYSRSSANNEALSVWVVDGDGKMWERTEAQWIGPYSLSTGRRIVSAPSVTGYPNNPMARSVFVVDSGGDLRQAYTSDGSDWSWFNLGNAGTKLLGSPVHLWGASNAESVFAVDDKGDLQEIHWDGSGSVGRWINHGRGDAALLVGESPGGYYSKALGDDVVFLVDENGNFMRFNSFQGWSNLGNGGAKFVSQAAGVELAIFLLVDENGDLQRYLTTWENLSHP